MLRIALPKQLTLFTELVETETTPDHVNDVGTFVMPPPGKGWRITDYSHEKRTTRPVTRVWKGHRK